MGHRVKTNLSTSHVKMAGAALAWPFMLFPPELFIRSREHAHSDIMQDRSVEQHLFEDLSVPFSITQRWPSTQSQKKSDFFDRPSDPKLTSCIFQFILNHAVLAHVIPTPSKEQLTVLAMILGQLQNCVHLNRRKSEIGLSDQGKWGWQSREWVAWRLGVSYELMLKWYPFRPPLSWKKPDLTTGELWVSFPLVTLSKVQGGTFLELHEV